MIELFQYPHETLLQTSTPWTETDSIQGYDDREKFESELTARLDTHETALVDGLQRIMARLEPPPPAGGGGVPRVTQPEPPVVMAYGFSWCSLLIVRSCE